MRISDWSSDVCSSDLEQLRGIAERSIAIENAWVEPNYLHCSTATGWYFRFFNESESLDYIEAIEVAPLETWYHGPGPVRSALEQLGEIGMPLRDALYEAAGVRSEEYTSELQSLMRSSYAVF